MPGDRDSPPGSVLVIGIGNELRGDDGAGVQVVRRLRERAGSAGIDVREVQGETTELLDAWRDRDGVVLVDSMRSGAAPGTVRRLDAGQQPLPVELRGSTSTHAFALGEAVELARALDRLPGQLLVYAIEGREFEAGAGLSGQVDAVIDALADEVLRTAHQLVARPTPRPH